MMAVSERKYHGVTYIYMTYRDDEKKVRTSRRKVPEGATAEDIEKIKTEMTELEKKALEDCMYSYLDLFWWKDHPKYFHITTSKEGTSPYSLRVTIGSRNLSRVFGRDRTFDEAFELLWTWLTQQLSVKDTVHRDVCKAIVKMHMRDKFVNLHNELTQKAKAA